MHWASKYIGMKWEIGARGPDSFDCWGLVYHIYKYHYQIELPLYPGILPSHLLAVANTITGETKENQWARVMEPSEGLVVALSKRSKVFHHVGLYIEANGGVILHATDNGHVIAQRIGDLRRDGWRRIEFYRYNNEN